MKEERAPGTREIADLYRRFVSMVRGRALRILGNPAAAEDVAQETFIRYLKRRRAGETEENTAGMLYRIVTNLSLNLLRDARRRREILKAADRDVLPSSPPEPDDRVVLREILAKVPEKEAEIAACYFIDGMEQEEIAAALCMQRRTVGRRLERFRERARRLLQGMPGREAT